MLHNSGPYGPNDVPINMGVPVNMTQIPNPINLGNNLNNLAKIPQQSPQTSASNYTMPDYSSFGHPPLNIGHSMSPFANYQHVNFQTSYGHPNPTMTHAIVPNNIQNNMLPMNLNTTSESSPSLMNYHSLESKRLDVNNTPYTENLTRKMPINIPQIPSKTFHKHLGMDSSYGQYSSILEDPFNSQDLSRAPERSLMDSSRRKSLENTVKLIENILINSTPKDKLQNLNSIESCLQKTNSNDTNVDPCDTNTNIIDDLKELQRDPISNDKTENINQNNEEPNCTTQIMKTKIDSQDYNVTVQSKITPNQIIDLKTSDSRNSDTSIDNATKSTKHIDNTTTNSNATGKTNTKLLVKNMKKRKTTKIQSEIHCEPLRRSLINNRILPNNKVQNKTEDETESENEELITEDNIKKEANDEDEDAVTVKVEPLDYCDTDNAPFLRDINATHRDNVEFDAVIIEENSVSEAQEAVTKGANPKTYYECPHCNLVFRHPKRFLIHTKWHLFGLSSGKRQELAREKELKKSMKREARIIERLNSKEVKDGAEGDKHPCKDCDKVFSAKSSLKNHRQRYHPTRVRQCKICNASVVGWMALRAHMAAHAAGTGYQCPECPKRFKYAHSLGKHKDTHLEKTHGCQQCEKKFGSQALLKMHMKCHERTARGATFRCTYCAKAFFESYNLQVHERTHRNERPFLCEICKTSFGTNSSLKRHLKVSHSTAKPFACPTCHRCFASDTTRARHVSRAHGDPATFTHACALCPRRYKALKELHRHMSKSHPETKE